MGDTGIPGVDETVQEAMAKIRREDPGMLTQETVLDRFSDAVETVFGATYDAYKMHERGRIEACKKGFTEGLPETVTKERAEKVVSEAVDGVRELKNSLEQSGASRAGKSLERIVQKLLALAGIPSEAVTPADKKHNLGRIGLVVPGKQAAIDSPDKSHFLSLKTSLRERGSAWSKNKNRGRTHLIAVLRGETLGDGVAREIVKHGVFLYLPDRIKDGRFSDEPRIRRLSDLPFSVGREYVDRARAQRQ